jgi:hypothetical protein
MEAAATPFPREETTPPVTKMYFGAVRKSGEILRDGLRTKHYAGIWGECQITNFFWGDLFFWIGGGDQTDLTQSAKRKAEDTEKDKGRIAADAQRHREKLEAVTARKHSPPRKARLRKF